MTKILLVAAVLGLAWFVFLRKSGDLAGPEARKLVAGGARLLDVRTPGEFASGHIPGAINVPVQELERRLAEVGGKDQEIVIYCRSGNRSATAKRMLAQAGFSKLHDLGAIGNW